MNPRLTYSCALFICAATALVYSPSLAKAEPVQITAIPGWAVLNTTYSFTDLNSRLDDAVKKNKMGVVTTASASMGASAQGIKIAGNRVAGVFRNDFARRMLAASIPAGIEAPVRFYVTENTNGTATLSYKKPSVVFAPYLASSGPDLLKVVTELDAIFESIAKDATVK
jgi:uncharacterized protein (DUF302 family)